MARLLLESSAGVALTPGATTVTNGQIVSTEAVVVVASDILSHEDGIEVSVKIDSGTAGESVSITIAEGNTAAEFDGGMSPSSIIIVDAQFRNCQVPFPIICDGGVQRATGVFRLTKPRFIIAIRNNGALAIDSLVVSYRKLNYESV